MSRCRTQKRRKDGVSGRLGNAGRLTGSNSVKDEAFEPSQAEVGALPGAQRRGTWAPIFNLYWLFPLLPAPGPPTCGYKCGRGRPHHSRSGDRRYTGNYFWLLRSISSRRLRSSISSTLPYQRRMSPDGPRSGDPRERIHLHSREEFFTLYSTSMGDPDCSPSRSFLIVGSTSSGCRASSHPRLRVFSLPTL